MRNQRDIYFLRICHLRLLCKIGHLECIHTPTIIWLTELLHFSVYTWGTDKTRTLFPGRPQSPPTQAPYPPGHTPPSSSVLPHSSQQGRNPSNLQCSLSGDDIEEAGQTLPHVSTSPEQVQRVESSFYDEIIDNELANDYSDVAEVWMEWQ